MNIPKNIVEKNLKYFHLLSSKFATSGFLFLVHVPAFEIIMVETGSAGTFMHLGWSHCFSELVQAGYSTVNMWMHSPDVLKRNQMA